MKKLKFKTEFNFVPYIGLGIGSQRIHKGRSLLIFLPFITIELLITNTL